MDENLIEQLLNEEIPEWEFEELKTTKDKKAGNLNGDAMSVYTEDDDDTESCKVNSLSNFGGVTASSTNDIMSVHSSNGGSVLSPKSSKRVYYTPLAANRDENNFNIIPHRTGKLIKHSILTKIANQISTSKSKANGGNPTCIARGKYLAIGTSKGITFLFDLKQVLKFYVGSDNEQMNFGAVSSLSFNVNSSRLLVGFVKAHINMWDISGNEGKLLRSINVNQGPGYAVSFVRFLPDPTMAVYADTNGSVFQMIFKRGLSGRSTDLECFFSGSRGEILCLESLFISKHVKKHELEEYSLLAMASFTKVIIVSFKPQLKVKFMHPLKGSSETMPHIQWTCNTRIKDTDGSNNKDVFLTFARDSEVHILKVTPTNNAVNDISLEFQGGDLKFEHVFNLNLDLQILSLKWMNPYCLGVLDFEEQFHALDIQSRKIVESLDIKSAQIVYNTSLFKSTATGGNVSEAMEAAAERACYHSVVEQNGQIKLLGQQIHIIMLRPWMEAIEVSRKNRGPEVAFKMCSDLYRGSNLACRQVLMLPSKNEDRQRAVTKVALNLMESILADPPLHIDYNLFFVSMLDLCISLKQIKFFTDIIFTKLPNNADIETAFIRSILPLILNNTSSELHPELAQRLVDYLHATAPLSQLDLCVTKLTISCLDLDKIIKLSTKYHLFSSFIHVYNSAFNDYISPIKYMIDFISNSQSAQPSDIEMVPETVIKAIVYIHCCFAGKDFFSGNELPTNIVENVKLAVFDYLIPFDRNTDMIPLNTLLVHNTNEFLNMITLAFDEPFFISDIGISRKQATLQRLCSHFISDKFPTSIENRSTKFFIFLSRELNKSTNVSVYIDQSVMDELIERVCLAIIDKAGKWDQNQSLEFFVHKQAETAFLNFLKNHQGYRDHWLKNERILNLSRRAQFYRVCEFIYRQKRMLHMVLECFLLDTDYRMEAFELIESVWSDETVDDRQRCQMMDKCFQLADSLVLANSNLSVVVLLTVCKKSLDEIIDQLRHLQTSTDGQNRCIFSFLKSFFLIRNETEIKESDYEHFTTVSQEISGTIKSIKVSQQMAELFIDLLCQFDVDGILFFLKHSIDYRNENAIRIISKYRLPYPLGFLYEKSRQFQLASNLYIKVFEDLWQTYVDRCQSEQLNRSSAEMSDSFRQCIDIFVRLVKKAKSSNKSSSENLWSVMLDSMLRKQVFSRTKPLESVIEMVFNYFVKILSQEVSMPTIMMTILKNPVFTGENFGKIRELVILMINSFNYDKILLESCIALMEKDVTNCVVQLKTVMGSGSIVAETKCSHCSKQLGHFYGKGGDIVSFRCGHQFHGECIGTNEVGSCILCHANMASVRNSPFTRSLPSPTTVGKKPVKS